MTETIVKTELYPNLAIGREGSREECKERKEAFLAILSKCWPNISKACKEVGITRQAAYLWRSNDETFRIQWLNIQDTVLDALEDNITQVCLTRGGAGYAFPVLKAYRRHIWGDQLEHSGQVGTVQLMTSMQRPPDEHGKKKLESVGTGTDASKDTPQITQ